MRWCALLVKRWEHNYTGCWEAVVHNLREGIITYLLNEELFEITNRAYLPDKAGT
jgi:hypothetical protein